MGDSIINTKTIIKEERMTISKADTINKLLQVGDLTGYMYEGWEPIKIVEGQASYVIEYDHFGRIVGVGHHIKKATDIYPYEFIRPGDEVTSNGRTGSFPPKGQKGRVIALASPILPAYSPDIYVDWGDRSPVRMEFADLVFDRIP